MGEMIEGDEDRGTFSMIGKMVDGSQGVMNYGPYTSSIPLNIVIGVRGYNSVYIPYTHILSHAIILAKLYNIVSKG